MSQTELSKISRRLPIGVELLDDGSTVFRVFAPKARRVHVVLFNDENPPVEIENLRLQDEENGYFSLRTTRAPTGTRYGFRLNNGGRVLPDPASRFQPQGPSGLSQVIDHSHFSWTDSAWKGIGPRGQVIYEMHFGTFTPEGTYASASKQLAELKRIGITLVELMPVADFPGQFGWGYDGVNLFAPTRLYGQPDDFRRFVDEAHRVGLGVILDVVYNHFGNVDNYLGEFASNYKSTRYQNEWADAINFDGDQNAPVREFFEANVRYWIDEFHLDGFRYDATQSIYDASDRHILAVINQAARDAAGSKQIYLTSENETEDVRMVRSPAEGGYGMDSAWNDDFHHSAHVRMTGNNPAYYSDFQGAVSELAAAIKHGFIYQGQRSQWQKKPRGTPTKGLPATAFVSFLQNHDQVSNSATGRRIHRLTSPGRFRAMTALWLLAPQTPLIFQGQEFGASQPFLYFADYQGDMAKAVRRGRHQFLTQFPNCASPEVQRSLDDPCRVETFDQSKLDFSERETHHEIYNLHIDLLKLRRTDAVFAKQDATNLESAILSTDCLAVRYFGDADSDRLVIANFGSDLHLIALAEPLLAPPANCVWSKLWDSNDQRYGGPGIALLEVEDGWQIPGEATIVLQAAPTKAE